MAQFVVLFFLGCGAAELMGTDPSDVELGGIAFVAIGQWARLLGLTESSPEHPRPDPTNDGTDEPGGTTPERSASGLPPEQEKSIDAKRAAVGLPPLASLYERKRRGQL